jgi:thioredoxin:protein disulfide reductase
MLENSNRKITALILIVFILTIFAVPSILYAIDDTQGPEAKASSGPVALEAYVSHSKIAPGGEFYVLVKLIVDEGWHVNSNKPNDEFLIPTELTLGEGAPVRIKNVDYPSPKSVKFEFSPDAPLSVYDKEVWIKATITVNNDAKPGKIKFPVQATVQACDNRSCVAPVTHILLIPLEIDPAALAGNFRHRDLLKSMGMIKNDAAPVIPTGSQELEVQPPVQSVSTEPVEPPANQSFWGMLKNFKADAFVGKHGYLLAFIAMYLLGLGLTLTPCVYPIIPITIGYFGTQSDGKMARQFFMALVFGVGIAISYAAVGTIAALSGSLMGAALQSKWILMALALLCVVMGFNAFGAFEIPLPGWLMNMAGSGSRKGVAGAALMGLTMGIAAAPCLAAFIVSLLAFVGQKGDPVLGFSMFFILGLGLATPFIALGTFSGLISKVPRSGAWMVYAKKIMGALLFAAAIYFLNPVLYKPLHHALVVIALVAAGLYFGFFEPTPAKTWKFRIVRYLFAILFIGGAIWWEMPEAGSTAQTQGIAWQKYSDSLLQKAQADNKPVVIDFFADWCIPCKELDKISFSDKRVVEASQGMITLKADLTSGSSPESQALITKYGIRGVPTVVFIKPDGTEESDLRINQFEKPDAVLTRFKKLQLTIDASIKPTAISSLEVSPIVKTLPLDKSEYFEVLGKSEAHSLHSGLVTLEPGKDVGSHSTDNYEELIIVLDGHGEIEIDGAGRTSISKGQIAYNPPQTKHNVFNNGSSPLRYIYIVTLAI